VPLVFGGQATSSGCRSVSEQIWYDLVQSPGFRRARIWRIEGRDGRSVLTVLLGTEFYSSSDYGKSWIPVSPPVEGMVAPSDRSIVYGYKTNGVIQRSQDGGKTWIVPTTTVDGASASDTAFRVSNDHSYVLEFDIAAIHPLRGLTIYASIRVTPPRSEHANFSEQFFLKGLYVSDDGGTNWRQFSDKVGIFSRYSGPVVLGIHPSRPEVMFGEGESGILRSTDGGKTWQPVGQSDLLNLEPLDTEDRAAGILAPRKQVPLNVDEFVFDPTSADVVYVRSRKGIHRSLDGGHSWTLLNLGFDQLRAVYSFAVDPLQPSRVFAGTARGLFMSEDRGCHFVKMSAPEPTDDPHGSAKSGPPFILVPQQHGLH
jgi:hypothetical protein